MFGVANVRLICEIRRGEGENVRREPANSLFSPFLSHETRMFMAKAPGKTPLGTLLLII